MFVTCFQHALNVIEFGGHAVIERTRAVRRETLREALRLWTTPFWADRMSTGSTDFNAASAIARSPLTMASSTLRTLLFNRVERL